MVPTVERGLRPAVFCWMLIGGRQPADVIDVRLRQLAEELPGVAGQRFDVPPLALGVERVERERTLARAADAGEDDQLVARQVEVDVAEVVFAGAADDDGLSVHEGCIVGIEWRCG